VQEYRDKILALEAASLALHSQHAHQLQALRYVGEVQEYRDKILALEAASLALHSQHALQLQALRYVGEVVGTYSSYIFLNLILFQL